jgi:hypothetical protein
VERSPAAERDANPPPRNATLRVQVTDVDEGRRAVEPLLDTLTKTWRRARISGAGGAVAVLEYEIRLRRRHPADELRSRVQKDGQPFVVAVELSPQDQAVTQTATLG